jgi:hypothetical protein
MSLKAGLGAEAIRRAEVEAGLGAEAEALLAAEAEVLVGAGASLGVSRPLDHGQGLYHHGHALVHNHVHSPDPSRGQGRVQGHHKGVAGTLVGAGAGAYHDLVHLRESLTGVHLQHQVMINS